ncbi:MFS transporter [Streptomyces hainanensis]|uniref:MFS transporter n=1 Tax=Streptomyces hainanensis TaxID=402648 RepID=UPI0026CF8398
MSASSSSRIRGHHGSIAAAQYPASSSQIASRSATTRPSSSSAAARSAAGGGSGAWASLRSCLTRSGGVRRGPGQVNLVCLLGTLLSAAVLAGGSRGGAAGLAALVLGTLLLDVAMQCGMVANQARVYALRPDARGRLNTAYMTCAYLGGGAGSWLGARLYGRGGWPAVCALLATLTGLALARHLVGPRALPREGHPRGTTGRRARPDPAADSVAPR